MRAATKMDRSSPASPASRSERPRPLHAAPPLNQVVATVRYGMWSPQSTTGGPLTPPSACHRRCHLLSYLHKQRRPWAGSITEATTTTPVQTAGVYLPNGAHPDPRGRRLYVCSTASASMQAAGVRAVRQGSACSARTRQQRHHGPNCNLLFVCRDVSAIFQVAFVIWTPFVCVHSAVRFRHVRGSVLCRKKRKR